jgi:hypothetical protein
MLIGVVLIVIGMIRWRIRASPKQAVKRFLMWARLKLQQKTIPAPPITGGVALAGGLLMVCAGAKRISALPPISEASMVCV